MSYTERKRRGHSVYYYRARSYRENGEVRKERKYLGKNLSDNELTEKENQADAEFNMLSTLLDDDEVLQLEKLKEQYAKESIKNLRNRYEAFVSRFTHDSTAIEGNTLTLQETAGLIFDGISPSRKTMREVNEVINHREAFDYLLGFDGDVTRAMILELHQIVVRNTLSEDIEDRIGRYRNVPVYIRGAEWIPPAPEDVPDDMKELISWYSKNRRKLHPMILASYFHIGFETIHPFVDGNGRVGRLLLNFILHRNGLPMVNIPNRRKIDYYNCLEKAQVEGDLRPFIRFIYERKWSVF